MSIDDVMNIAPSVTEGEKALKLFTDRHEFIRLFSQYLNDDIPKEKILFFYGDGGNGKSLLLKFLRQNCCKYFSREVWQQIKDESDTEFVAHFKSNQVESYIAIPSVLIDFSQNIGIESAQDPFYGLLMLRRNLQKISTELNYRLRFPLYDFACIWYLHKKGKSPEEIKSLFPLTEIAGSITSIIDAVSQSAIGAITKAVFDFFAKDLGEKFTIYLAKIGLSEDRIKSICNKDLDTELIYELPKLFAEDLKAVMEDIAAPKRVVLFFDTHESFWGEQKKLSDVLFFEKDEWFRRLLRALPFESGVIVVAAGRESPRWADANNVSPNTEIPLSFLHAKEVGNLSEADAKSYLEQVEITDIDLCQSLIAYANVDVNQVHPLYLGLGADVVLQAKKQGKSLTASDFKNIPDAENKSNVLINRLLKYVSRDMVYAVHALSACRMFDFELYRKLAQELDFQPTRSDFDTLVDFSFVWQIEQKDKDCYSIHSLIRRLDSESGNEFNQKAHAILEQHYREQDLIAEAIYHANQQDCVRGLEEWINCFDSVLESSNYSQCRNLLEVRNGLLIQNDYQLGRVSQSEGNYHSRLSRNPEAELEYTEAINAYERTLKNNPNHIQTSNNLGAVWLYLGKLQMVLSKYTEALISYERADNIYDQILSFIPDDISAITNKGHLMDSFGKVYMLLSRYSEAEESFNQSIINYDNALKSNLNDICLLNNKGVALSSLGELQANFSKHDKAIDSYKHSISCYELIINSNTLLTSKTYCNKGISYSRLGDSQTQLSQHKDAFQSYEYATIDFDKSLELSPNDISTICSKATSIFSLGKLQEKSFQYLAAFKSYESSICYHDLALSISPNDIYTLINKSLTLSSIAKLLNSVEHFNLAIDACNQAISVSPDRIEAYVNKGVAILGLALFFEENLRYSEALQKYKEAIKTCDKVLIYSPDNNQIHNNKGILLYSVGFIYARLNLEKPLSENTEFILSWENAIEEFNKSLKISPDDRYISSLRNILKHFLDNKNNSFQLSQTTYISFNFLYKKTKKFQLICTGT
jgi:tetratricopeptide (TPR) repeat protein